MPSVSTVTVSLETDVPTEEDHTRDIFCWEADDSRDLFFDVSPNVELCCGQFPSVFGKHLQLTIYHGHHFLPGGMLPIL